MKIGLLLLVAMSSCGIPISAAESARTHFRPGQPWLDSDGAHINAHGYCVLEHEGNYYWYGSHKIAGRTESEKNEAGVRCYVSSDLLNWKNSGLVLSVISEGQDPEVANAGILDRPKVIFNHATGKFVMYFKLYPPTAAGGMKGTDIAYVGVATATEPLGPFEYQGKFTGADSSNGSGDFAIFQDEDGSIYHIAVRKPDKSLVCGRMSEDGLRPAAAYAVMEGVTRATEAPALFRRDGKIYLLGSGSTGWEPNPARMFAADKIEGPYQSLGNPCEGINPHNQMGPEKTFEGQSTFVMPTPGKPDEWIAMFDIWNPEVPIEAGYIWLPLRFENEKPVIRWQDEWKIDAPLQEGEAQFIPGVPWLDQNGQQINAHGGGVIFFEGVYYWYGEHNLPGRSEAQFADGGVHCYSSTDLTSWKDEGLVLSVHHDDPETDLAAGCILERPKVLFNSRTKTFVMFFKYYPRGMGYEIGYVGVATANAPAGPFRFQHKFLGANSPKGSGDFSMFRDTDGVVYHLAVRKPDKAFCIGKLRDDYLFPEGDYQVVPGVPLHTEAPAIVIQGGKYYMLGSGSTGWEPNAARALVADAIAGPYRSLENPAQGVNPHNGLGPEKTFGGQSSFIIPVEGKKDAFIAMFDLWKPQRPIEGLYIWLPMEIRNGQPIIKWRDRWSMSHFEAPTASLVSRDAHIIAINQVGFQVGRSKRFTAPLSADDASFIVRDASGGDALFRSVIRGKIGDFSSLDVPAGRYAIEVSGGSLKPAVSDPFLIHPNLFQEQFWQPAVDFLIDSRSVIGNHPSAFGGCPWRDGTYYDAIVPALVLFHFADPARIAAMPRQIDWEAEKKRVLAADFKFDAKNPGSEGVMNSVRKYFNEIEPPAADAPDVVKLIHWGAGFYLVNPATKDPSKDPDPRQIHSQTVEQVAYVVWAWPSLKQWLPQSFYDKCRDFCEKNWAPSLEIDKWWDPATYLTLEQITGDNPMGGLLHPYKGRHAPGHSIVPNLLMHEVAKRDGLADPNRYLTAAVKQAEWIVKNLDWNDPRTTKGHRMSEHRTIPNLVWLLQNYPDQAPTGLKEKIVAWVDVALSRSDNLWDYRRFDLQDEWSIPKINDVGNLVSFPAIATAASWVLDDPAKKARLEQISTAAIDHVFGRNPRLAASPAKPEMGFPEIERGWPEHYKPNVCARLELCRGSISSAPGSEMFPFNPEGKYRHPEGWVNYGAAWCISLAYLQFDQMKSSPKPN
jgi:Glycosyl hydrolases family 43